MTEKYVIGIDFGTDSVRAVVVGTETGSIIGEGIAEYPRWKKGLYQHPDKKIFRQHPLDYLEGMSYCVQSALSRLEIETRKNIVAIGTDTTGSTPVPVDQNGIPLSLLEEFAECEDAMFFLWKDHSAQKESEQINEIFTSGKVNYCKYQGTYSSEWYWAKILHAVNTNPIIRERAYTWIEHCDWIVGTLCGNETPLKIYHSACAAGHKALWHSSWNGLPDDDTLRKLDPYLVKVKQHYGKNPQPASVKAGIISEKWANIWGLEKNVIISGSSFDAHAGAVGVGICEKTLVCTIGTSAVDLVVSKAENFIGKKLQSYGGQAENSILPGFVGIEAGQAAFGDIFAWFKKVLMWPQKQFAVDSISKKELNEIENQMLAQLEVSLNDLDDKEFSVALDWFNGRRYPNTDDSQRAAIMGLSLASDAPDIYRALLFGAVCGMKRIIMGFEEAGIEIDRVIAVGGISKKSPYVMQLMADLLDKSVITVSANQTCALGAAMYAAVAGGCYFSLEDAGKVMAAKEDKIFVPNKEKKLLYERKYQEYVEMAEAMDKIKEIVSKFV